MIRARTGSISYGLERWIHTARSVNECMSVVMAGCRLSLYGLVPGSQSLRQGMHAGVMLTCIVVVVVGREVVVVGEDKSEGDERKIYGGIAPAIRSVANRQRRAMAGEPGRDRANDHVAPDQ